ncbi:unnamed protein product [Caenorhabditis auriculariae]|uniref:Uncharacterized protein n=1 Tax=Caenorhabditis auriculariae TaxID=2777116 RepID=A0A8S1GYV2_9PELO|nr:unnamed protein product [Caenorhabditis auriculariae]
MLSNTSMLASDTLNQTYRHEAIPNTSNMASRSQSFTRLMGYLPNVFFAGARPGVTQHKQNLTNRDESARMEATMIWHAYGCRKIAENVCQRKKRNSRLDRPARRCSRMCFTTAFCIYPLADHDFTADQWPVVIPRCQHDTNDEREMTEMGCARQNLLRADESSKAISDWPTVLDEEPVSWSSPQATAIYICCFIQVAAAGTNDAASTFVGGEPIFVKVTRKACGILFCSGDRRLLQSQNGSSVWQTMEN